MKSNGSAGSDRCFNPLRAAERSTRRQKNRSRTLCKLMTRARVACPRLDADPAGNLREAPEKDVGVALRGNSQITTGIKFLQLNPFRLQIGKADAVVLKETFGKSKPVASVRALLHLEADAVVADTPPGCERAPKSGVESQLYGHIACSKIIDRTSGG